MKERIEWKKKREKEVRKYYEYIRGKKWKMKGYWRGLGIHAVMDESNYGTSSFERRLIFAPYYTWVDYAWKKSPACCKLNPDINERSKKQSSAYKKKKIIIYKQNEISPRNFVSLVEVWRLRRSNRWVNNATTLLPTIFVVHYRYINLYLVERRKKKTHGRIVCGR